MNHPFTREHLNQSILEHYRHDIALIESFVAQKQNVFLYLEGLEAEKTLLDHLQSAISTHRCINLDFKHLVSAKQLLSHLSKELLKAFSGNLKDIFEFSNKYMPTLKPQFQRQGSLRTELSINYTINEDTIYMFLKELFDSIEAMAKDFQKPILLVINHFDQIHFLNKRKAETLIREKISQQAQVNYLLACYQDKAIAKMFDKKNAPFYRIKKMHALQPLPEDFKLTFVLNTFAKAGMSIPQDLADLLRKRTASLHNVFLLSKKVFLLARQNQLLTPTTVKDAIREILEESGPLYANTWEDLSPHQKSLLTAIATRAGSQVFSARYLQENDLGSAPSVQTSISALLKKNILLKKEKDFSFCDHFFKEWILTITV